MFILVLACYAFAALDTVIGHANLFGLGQNSVCVDAPNLAYPMTPTLPGPGVSVNSDGATLCVHPASATQHALAVVIGILGPALFLGALFLLYRVLREAEYGGVFGDRVAGRLRTLGIFLVAAPLVAMVLKGSATAYYVASVSRVEAGQPFGVTFWQWPLPTLLAGLGALTFARIMRVGARMREDLDGTV
ncbi:MAG TPA: DUF2975 domain-containing protein [Pseudonocardiaceae bacterium]